MEDLLKAAICEDNPKDMEDLFSCIAGCNIATDCDRFYSGEDFLKEFTLGKYDIVFLDIYMGGMPGVDVALEIRKIDRAVTLVFTTTSTEHTLESYRMKAVAYLEKPITKVDIEEALSLALTKRNTRSYITLLIDGVNKRIMTEGILYFEHQNHAVTIYTQGENLRTSQSVKLDQIESMLPDYYFRCHHSYIVNLSYIREVDKDLAVFVMQDNSRVHIRRKDLKKAIRAYEDFLFASTREESK